MHCSNVQNGVVTRRKLVSTNRRRTIVRPSWECRGRVVGRLATTVSWTVFDNKTTVSWKPSWHYRVVDASRMVSWHRRGRVAGCPAMTVLWKPSWYPNVHNRGHCRWTVVGGHAIFPNARGQQAHSCRRPCNFVSPRPNTPSFPAKQIKKICYKKTRQCTANKAHSTGSGLSHLTIDIHPSQLHLTIEASEALATWSYKQRTHRVGFLQHTERYLETLHIQMNQQKLKAV